MDLTIQKENEQKIEGTKYKGGKMLARAQSELKKDRYRKDGRPLRHPIIYSFL